MERVVISLLGRCSLVLQRIGRVGKSLIALLNNQMYVPSLVFFASDTCILRCANCGSCSPFLTDSNLPNLRIFTESLSILSRFLRCDELVIAGGEPLLNKDLADFIRAAKKSGIFRNVTVVTNGLLLAKMDAEFWSIADRVQISVYPSTAGEFTRERRLALKATADKHKTRLKFVRISHFYKSIRDTGIADDRVVRTNFAACADAHEWSCHTLYGNKLYRCPTVHVLDRYLTNIGVVHESFTESDGILIDDRPELRQDIKKYLKSFQPLKACTFCNGTPALREEHRQLTFTEVSSKLRTAASDAEPQHIV